MIQLDDVSFSYQGTTAVSHVTYRFEMGKCYVLHGPNGCGKSTLFRILNGLDFPTSGRYLLDGEEITEKKMKKPEFARAFHKKIGYVFQTSEVQLFTKSVEDEIAFGLIQLGLPDSEVQKRVEKYIQLLHLQPIRRRAPFNLSGGEKKRTALAAVLAMEPPVLILDEPISGLDDEGQEWITRFISGMKSPDKLMIVATHNRTFTQRIADVEVLMNRDHCFEQSRPLENGAETEL
ncbi:MULTISPECIES: energy-coupling factor ABC transporter ATP-binding protein [Caproicibacterium]|nr:ABC transporter ATP-binding protein [Caproicibacterium lactatifermentans]MDD4808285.1 ABC transporter ATP-binding protein [Oscillospiraceae bacterium]